MDGSRAVVQAAVAICGLLLGFQSSARGLPRPPDNAALLYYRGFLACPEPDEVTKARLHHVLAGAEPNEAVRKYISGCKHAFELVDVAAKIPECNWGIGYSLGEQSPPEILLGQRKLVYALAAEACIRASEGDSQTALAECLRMSRMVQHAGPLGVNIESIACTTIRQVLGRISADADTLTWFRDELATISRTPPDLVKTARTNVELILQSVRGDDEALSWLRSKILKQADDDAKVKMTDDELIELARGPCTQFFDRAARIMNANLSYRQTYVQLDRLTKDMEAQAERNPAIFLTLTSEMELILRRYPTEILHLSQHNALRIALELYIAAARTGRLPKSLPPDQPIDPLTGEGFDYEIVQGGFILQSRAKEIPGTNGVVFEFAMKRQREPWETPTESDRREPTADSAVTAPTTASQTAEQAFRMEAPCRSLNDLQTIARDSEMPAPVQERAKAAFDRLQTRSSEGLRTPEPILIRASLRRVAEGGMVLSLIALDQDLDTAGLRIKEAVLAPNGWISHLTEDYPAYLRAPDYRLAIDPLFPVTIRDNGQRKDAAAWEAYLIDCYDWLGAKHSGAEAGQQRQRLDMPPIWISCPEPDKVRVFVCLYDRQRHESDYVEVENLLSKEPIDRCAYLQMLLESQEALLHQ